MHLNKLFLKKMVLAKYFMYSPHPSSCFSAEDAEDEFGVDEDA